MTPAEQRVVNGMTNWQRSKWARAGYPKAMDQLTHFLTLARPSRERHYNAHPIHLENDSWRYPESEVHARRRDRAISRRIPGNG